MLGARGARGSAVAGASRLSLRPLRCSAIGARRCARLLTSRFAEPRRRRCPSRAAAAGEAAQAAAGNPEQGADGRAYDGAAQCARSPISQRARHGERRVGGRRRHLQGRSLSSSERLPPPTCALRIAN